MKPPSQRRSQRFPPSSQPVRRWIALALLGLLLFTPASLSAADPLEPLRLTSQLVWGTDGAKPADAEFKELEPVLRKRLARIFKWKNYYEIRSRQIVIEEAPPRRLRMSEQCVLELTLPDRDTLQVRLIGEGRLTKTTRQPIAALRRGELLVLAGETKDNADDAWFVVLSVTPEKKEDGKPEDPPPGPPPSPAGTPRPQR